MTTVVIKCPSFGNTVALIQQSLQPSYERIRAEATRLAGEPGDIPQRATVLHGLYLDSKGNHTFPQVALHGALWGKGFFETTGTLGKAVSYRYVFSPKEKAVRMAMLNTFAQRFKEANRAVFVDTVTNYFFSKFFGGKPEAAQFLHPELLKALNTMHEAVRKNLSLSAKDKKALFEKSLKWEQENTVAPAIASALGEFDCPVLKFLCSKPWVRFAYFPGLTRFIFRNFSDTHERIGYALKSHDLAEKAGWDKVVSTMKDYGCLPDDYAQQAQKACQDFEALKNPF